jgi:hypothetical protein
MPHFEKIPVEKVDGLSRLSSSAGEEGLDYGEIDFFLICH